MMPHNDLGYPQCITQALMPEIKTGGEQAMIKIARVLVNMSVELNSELYGPYVVYKKTSKVHYVYQYAEPSREC